MYFFLIFLFFDKNLLSINHFVYIRYRIGVVTKGFGQYECFGLNDEQRDLIKKKGWVSMVLDKQIYGTMKSYKRAFTFFKSLAYIINRRQK